MALDEEIRSWICNHTNDSSWSTLSTVSNPGNGHVSIVRIPSRHYERAVSALEELGLSYNASRILTEEEYEKVHQELKSYGIEYLESPYTDAATFLAQLRFFIPSLWDHLGVGLIDLCGFSQKSHAGQLMALRQLDAILHTSNENSIDENYKNNPTMRSWGTASTGDGYYIFPVKPNSTLNIRVLRSLLLLMIEATFHEIEIKVAYSVGKCYTYFRMNQIENQLLTTERPRISTMNLIGPVSNELARILNQQKPNQILLSRNAIEYIYNNKDSAMQMFFLDIERSMFSAEYVEHASQYLNGLGMRYGDDISVRAVEFMIANMLTLFCSGKATFDGKTKFNPPEPLRLFGKHSSEEFIVYNLYSELQCRGTTIKLGLAENHIRRFSEIQFN